MIARLTGTLAELTADGAVIDVGGVGYLVQMSGRTLGALGGVGAEVMILTELQVREDQWTLFGFGSASERESCRALTSCEFPASNLLSSTVASPLGPLFTIVRACACRSSLP